MVDTHSASIAWHGTKEDLLKAYSQKWRPTLTSCSITYKNSRGNNVKITLADAEQRLFDMSFDPYHCIEMRWGAFNSHPDEMATCTMDAAHMQRFNDERTQRNAIDREYGNPTPFSFGPGQPEDVNVTEVLP
jgi:hypothetical protein